MLTALTRRQRSVLIYILWYWELNGYAPTYQELSDRFEVARSTMNGHARALRTKGYLVGLTITDEGLGWFRSTQKNPGLEAEAEMLLDGELPRGAEAVIKDLLAQNRAFREEIVKLRSAVR